MIHGGYTVTVVLDHLYARYSGQELARRLQQLREDIRRKLLDAAVSEVGFGVPMTVQFEIEEIVDAHGVRRLSGRLKLYEVKLHRVHLPDRPLSMSYGDYSPEVK